MGLDLDMQVGVHRGRLVGNHVSLGRADIGHKRILVAIIDAHLGIEVEVNVVHFQVGSGNKRHERDCNALFDSIFDICKRHRGHLFLKWIILKEGLFGVLPGKLGGLALSLDASGEHPSDQLAERH